MTGWSLPGFPALGRTRVMGVVNVTPDSFSDGGSWLEPGLAVQHGTILAAQGADLVDVGGESTRPGAGRVPEAVELARVIPVVEGLVAHGIVVSIDTTRPRVAAAALDAGARMINDVSGGDTGLPALAAQRGVAYVLMHSRGESADMTSAADYDDVVAQVCAELAARLQRAVVAGLQEAWTVLDPGLGFHKRAPHNWTLLSHLDDLAALGRPLLVGASRKGFLGALLAGPDGPRAVDQRDAATHAVTALAAAAGVWGIRVHEVPASVDAVRVAAAWTAAR